MFIFKKAKSAKAKNKALKSKLDAYLDAAKPQPVYLLCQFWDAQKAAITYGELNVALLNGFESQFKKWQDDYAFFVNNTLKEEWLKAMEDGSQLVAGQFQNFIFDDTAREVREWIDKRGAEFVAQMTEQARLALRNVIMHGQAAGMTNEQLAHAIRPLIGLNAQQAAASQHYYERTIAALTRDHPKTNPILLMDEARKRQARYAGRQHRYRADTIATTELAFAYNKGQHEGVRQAMQRGLMGNCVKVWSTAASERTCPECSALNGQRAKFDEPFDGGYDVPPAHPRCRCTVKYVDATDAERSATAPEMMGNSAGSQTSQAGYNGLESAATRFAPAKGIAEAEQFARDVLKIPNVSYKGLDIVVANEMNRGFMEVFERYPALRNCVKFAGETHERNKFLMRTILEKQKAALLTESPHDVQERLAAWWKSAGKNKWRQVRRYIRAKNFDIAHSFYLPNTIFSVVDGITFNRNYARNAKDFVSVLERCVRVRFHPEGCATIRAMFDHEVGHLLDGLLEIGEMPSIQAVCDVLTVGGLSGGAFDAHNLVRPKEMIAEAWSEYCNHRPPRAVAATVGGIIEREYARRFP